MCTYQLNITAYLGQGGPIVHLKLNRKMTISVHARTDLHTQFNLELKCRVPSMSVLMII